MVRQSPIGAYFTIMARKSPIGAYAVCQVLEVLVDELCTIDIMVQE